MIQRSQRLLKVAKRAYFSTLTKAASQQSGVSQKEFLQFSKAKLTDFGDLPQGTIPEALNYDLPFKLSQLENGVKVATEEFSQAGVASITVSVKTGTRFETLETSGVSQFIANLVQRGTASKSRQQVEQQLASLGGQFSAEVGRELTTFTLTFEAAKVESATELLGDMLLNSVFNKNQIEAEREGIYRNCIENQKDQKETTIEAVHYTSYRDHFIGQPVLGIRENIANVTEQAVKDFHSTHYVAENIALVGAGQINHDAFLKAAEKAFGKAPQRNSTIVVPNTEKPYFTPSTMFMRDDEMANLNIGVFFDAPTVRDQDYFGMKVFEKVMGEYQADKYTGAHLNSAERQYNTMHTELGQMPDVTLHKCEYIPHSDCGLFGNYLYGNEVFGNQILFLSQYVLTEYASYINSVEVFRAKNAIYNELLNKGQDTSALSQEIAQQLQLIGRRIPRSEYAQRVSHFDAGLLQNVASKHFWDAEISVVAWGPTHHLMAFSHYNRPIKRSTLGWYGSQHLRIL